MWCVYIICSTKRRWYYVGSTNRLRERLEEHNAGSVNSTKPYIPFKLVYKKQFESESDARLYERKIKDRRIEKENIIKLIENESK